MSGFPEFICKLKQAGVTIEGEVLLGEKAAEAEDWTEEVERLALVGRDLGIRFTRASMDWPSNQQLDAVLRGYAFSEAARGHLVENVITLSSVEDFELGDLVEITNLSRVDRRVLSGSAFRIEPDEKGIVTEKYRTDFRVQSGRNDAVKWEANLRPDEVRLVERLGMAEAGRRLGAAVSG